MPTDAATLPNTRQTLLGSQRKYRARAGTDYTTVNQTVTFAASQTSQTVIIPILNDGQIDARRNFTATLSSPTDGAALGTTTQTTVTISSVNGTADQQYVVQVYADLLLREADAGGLAFWIDSIENKHQPRKAIAAAFSHSAEYYATNIVKPTYLKFLGRAADQGGLDFWVGQLSHGVTDEQFLASFVSTPEYFQTNGGANTPYVDALFRDLLGRTPDTGGEMFWVGQLTGGASRFSVALGFANSIEEARIRVQNVYLRFLGRAADTDGLIFWVNGFAHGSTDEDIITGFIGSDEYFRQATS